jgi:hypothetical protein
MLACNAPTFFQGGLQSALQRTVNWFDFSNKKRSRNGDRWFNWLGE